MIQLIFATNNQHKVEEIQSAVGDRIEVISLKDAGIDLEIPEPHQTLEDNAGEKSKTIYNLTKKNCFAEDTGLEVYSLGGLPGVHSARYAGNEKSFEKNIQKLLKNLDQKSDRTARFHTVISLIWEGREYLFEGATEGQIIHKSVATMVSDMTRSLCR